MPEDKAYGSPLPNPATEGLLKKAKDRMLGSTEWSSKQDFDADLTAIAASTGTGLLTRTAADTWATRTLTAPAAGLTITNPAGIAGNPTFALANDLAALEAFSSTNGIPYRSSAYTWGAVTIGAGISFTGGVLSASSSYVPVPGSPFTVTTDLTIPGLGGYYDLLVSLEGIEASSAGFRRLRVGHGAGPTILSTTGDYIEMRAVGGTVGLETNFDYIAFTNSSDAARGGVIHFPNWNTSGEPKIAIAHNIAWSVRIPTSNPLTALNLTNTAGVPDAGLVRVWGKAA
jgi:hypothetical protein